MKSFVMMSVLTEEGRKTVQDFPERIGQVNKSVEKLGAKIVSQYALLGPYDFLTVIEAEDERAMFRISTELAGRGTLQTVTFPAMPVGEFVKDIAGE